MRLRLSIWLVLCSFTLASTAHAAETWALLIGISKYQSNFISSLRFPAADATGISDALLDPQLGNLPADHVRLLTDETATATNIMGAVDNFLKPNVKTGDSVIIFMAGHGVAKGMGASAKSYLLATDTNGLTTPALDASAVSLQVLATKLGQLPASQFVLFVDACRDDPTPGRGIKGNQLSDVLSRGLQFMPQDMEKPTTVVTFFACAVGQRAYEDPKLEHGVFTYWILDALNAGPVPEPDGTVGMARLSKYVSDKVASWAHEASGGRSAAIATDVGEEFDGVQQTPQNILSDPITNQPQPVTLIRVKRPVNATPVQPAPPTLALTTFPEGAIVTVDGRKAGIAPTVVTLSGDGASMVKVEAPGYITQERPVKVPAGYQFQMTIRLLPDSRSAGAEDTTLALYQRALNAEALGQWEVASAGYSAVLRATPKYAPAYERLAQVQQRLGNPQDALNTLLQMNAQLSPSERTLSLLSRAYTAMAVKLGTKDNAKLIKKRDKNSFGVPKKGEDAAAMAVLAAEEALKIAPDSARSQLALGFALVVADPKGKNKSDVIKAFSAAVIGEPEDASNQYGMGYGIRYYAQFAPDESERKAEAQRAIPSLQQALKLRPDFYEAHREMAYCYHLLGETERAQQEYVMANANRGAATDRDEVAGLNVALAALHQQQATESKGEDSKEHEQASAAYLEDAREITPDLKQALKVLQLAGVDTNLRNFLPSEVQKLMTLPNFRPSPIDIIGGGIKRPRLPF